MDTVLKIGPKLSLLKHFVLHVHLLPSHEVPFVRVIKSNTSIRTSKVNLHETEWIVMTYVGRMISTFHI